MKSIKELVYKRRVRIGIWVIFLALPSLVIFNLLAHNLPIGVGYFLLGTLCTIPAIILATLFNKKQLRIMVIVAGISTSLVVNTLLLSYMTTY